VYFENNHRNRFRNAFNGSVRLKKRQNFLSVDIPISNGDSAFEKLKVDISYLGSGLGNGDGLELRYKLGGRWQEAIKWEKGSAEFLDDGVWYHERVTILNPNGVSSLTLRFRGMGRESNDHVYLQNFELSGLESPENPPVSAPGPSGSPILAPFSTSNPTLNQEEEGWNLINADSFNSKEDSVYFGNNRQKRFYNGSVRLKKRQNFISIAIPISDGVSAYTKLRVDISYRGKNLEESEGDGLQLRYKLERIWQDANKWEKGSVEFLDNDVWYQGSVTISNPNGFSSLFLRFNGISDDKRDTIFLQNFELYGEK